MASFIAVDHLARPVHSRAGGDCSSIYAPPENSRVRASALVVELADIIQEMRIVVTNGSPSLRILEPRSSKMLGKSVG